MRTSRSSAACEKLWGGRCLSSSICSTSPAIMLTYSCAETDIRRPRSSFWGKHPFFSRLPLQRKGTGKIAVFSATLLPLLNSLNLFHLTLYLLLRNSRSADVTFVQLYLAAHVTNVDDLRAQSTKPAWRKPSVSLVLHEWVRKIHVVCTTMLKLVMFA